MSNYIVDSADLTSVANAIRTKGGTSASLAFPAEFVQAIQAIPTGGGGLPAVVLNHETIVAAANYTSSNRLTLQLSPVENYILIDFAAEDIEAGSATRWLASAAIQVGNATAARSGNIRRADGTIGTDSGALSGFTKSTGVLTFPSSQYSNMVAGKTYEFWLFEILGGGA